MKRVALYLALTAAIFAKIEVINLQKAKEYFNTNSALFIDARPYKKYKEGTISKAINVPLKRAKRFKKYLPNDKNATLVLFCGGVKCNYSSKLSKKFAKYGYKNIKVFKEGFPKWKSRNLPIMVDSKECTFEPIKKRVLGHNIELKNDSTLNSAWIVSLINKNKLPKDILLVDVRDKKEFKKAHLKGAINLPFNKNFSISSLPKDRLIFFYCNQGNISLEARDSLDKNEQKRVFIIDAKLNCNNKSCKLENFF